MQIGEREEGRIYIIRGPDRGNKLYDLHNRRPSGGGPENPLKSKKIFPGRRGEPLSPESELLSARIW